MAEISKITIPNPLYGQTGQPATVTYDIKDATARTLIAQGTAFHFAKNAETTPYGVTWDNDGVLVTGTLVASATTMGFYFVPDSNGSGKDIYAEYVATNDGGWAWEKLGDTEIQISVTLNKDTDSVLGASTTISASASAVTFNSDGSTDTFVKSYPGASSKLETASVTTISSSTDYSATNTVFGTATTASKATAGTAVSVAKVAASATDVSRITLSNGNTSILETATFDSATETLVFGKATVTQSSVTGTNGTESITPYSFTDVSVPVVSSNNQVTTTKVTTTSTTIATGSLKSDDSVGATVMTGLGTATTGSAIKTLPTASAAGQTITIGDNDLVTVLTDDTSISVD